MDMSKRTRMECRLARYQKGEVVQGMLFIGIEFYLHAARAAAAKKDGECLSKNIGPFYANQILDWRCAAGHTWSAKWRDVRSGAWCFACSTIRGKDTIGMARHKAESNGGRCLSTAYGKDCGSKLSWECAEGHVWEASWKNVKRGSWCRVCSFKNRRRKC